jgi:S-disulfanyl-L-cysteine oxidoreductase SoxD
MSTLRATLLAALGVLAAGLVGPAAAQSGYPQRFDFGTTPSPAELAHFFAIPPDGTGLGPGKGGYAEGKKVYAENCAVCHGDKLEGIIQPELRGDKLIGGRGTLTTAAAIKTVESYWPYATTLFDFVKRAMPMPAPGSLSDDQVYAVVAYILGEAKIIDTNAVLDAKTLPKVAMPNRDGFIGDPRPEIELYR